MKTPRLVLLAALLAGTAFSIPVPAATENWRERSALADEITSGDVTAEITLGRQIAARILGRFKAYDDPALIKYVNLVGLSLAKQTNRPELNFRFMVLDSNEVNAYASPGGYIFVTSGALKLMNDEAELAGVLAHEIAHITEKHVVKELNIKGADHAELAQLIGASSESARNAFVQAVDKGLDIIFKGEYKREDELQSDSSAVMLCALGNYEMSGLARYLDRVRSVKGEVPDDGQTHPSYANRISLINNMIGNSGVEGKSRVNLDRFAVATKALKGFAIQR
ncbi:MAG: M48 family metalloprotease [Gallionellaceae bacterium]|jgi:predicted Zn-dependent protease